MKHQSKRPAGKILHHGHASGLTDARDIEQRASEIARIEDHHGVSDDDVRQAERELDGQDLASVSDDDADSRGALSLDPSEPPSNFGHQIPDQESEDEFFAAERLVAEGVSEAEHDQRLAARRRRNS